MGRPAELDYESLVCPRCGSGYLHHGPVRVFSAQEDEDGTLTTVTCEASVTIAPCKRSSMPGRRHSLEIDFYCEDCGDNCPDIGPDGNEIPDPDACTCGGLSECRCGKGRHPLTLRIMQHKGMTLVEWVRL